MARVSFFIDGFNLYHALDNDNFQYLKWLNLRKLSELYLGKQDCLSDIFYFSALAIWNPEKIQRHKLYITLTNGSQIYCPERWKEPLVIA